MIALVKITAQELPAFHKPPHFLFWCRRKELIDIGLINKITKEDQFVTLSKGDREERAFFSVKCLYLLLHHVGEKSHIP